ncbi:hypothetical protein C8J56DRAFT_542375 [Mycena floridula]|nr:hypothetical protein C8J56DRAFT_542375 [Mycena floridula]
MTDSDLSDLSDITDSETEEAVPIPKIISLPSAPAHRTRNPPQHNQARLAPPVSRTYAASWLYTELQNNRINLDPEYQRDVVWTDTKQSSLIDSLYHNYYVPSLIFSVDTNSEGYEIRTCIDGKQRLSSIQRFMNGDINYKDSVTGKRLFFQGEGKKKVITPQQRQRLEGSQIPCVEYRNLTDEQEREIFMRVQMGVALTPAERMMAINGPYPRFLREIKDRLSTGIPDTQLWNNHRSRDFTAIARSLYMIDDSCTVAEPTNARIEAWLSSEEKEVPETLRRNAKKVVEIVIRLVSDHIYGKSFQKLSPSEITMTLYLVYHWRDSFTMCQLADATAKMRKHIRADIRGEQTSRGISFNTKVYKTMLSFIRGLKQETLKTDDDKTPAWKYRVEGLPSKRKESAVEEGPAATRSARSSKKQVIESDAEMDERPTAKRTASVTPKRKAKAPKASSDMDVSEAEEESPRGRGTKRKASKLEQEVEKPPSKKPALPKILSKPPSVPVPSPSASRTPAKTPVNSKAATPASSSGANSRTRNRAPTPTQSASPIPPSPQVYIAPSTRPSNLPRTDSVQKASDPRSPASSFSSSN